MTHITLKPCRNLGFAVVFLACSPAPAPQSTSRPARAQPAAVTAIEETCAQAPAGPGALVVCNLEFPGAFRVKNETGAAVSARARVDVEVLDENHTWQQTRVLLYLDPRCQPEPPLNRCVTLEPGAVLQPYRWSGFSCSGQCRRHCPGNHYLRGWSLRFVVSSCDGLERYPGPAFRLPEYEDAPL